MKVMVVGANGLIGTDVCKEFISRGIEVVPITHSEMEIADIDSVNQVLKAVRPNVIINTAAFHNLEQCEIDVVRAFEVNAVGARILAQISEDIGAYLIHISTNYVFDGEKKEPYLESDRTMPLNVYGNSKLAGEYFVLNQRKLAAVLRVSSVYGAHPCRAKDGGLNFVNRMLKLAAEGREIVLIASEKSPVYTPTYSVDIAGQIVVMVKDRITGLIHGTAHGSCTAYELAQEIFRISGTKANLKPMEPDFISESLKRPLYSVLKNHVLNTMQRDMMPDWQQSLKRYLASLR